MTKISNLYALTNYITANTSGNVVIVAPTSGTALYVTGSAQVTGQLTLGSTITNGTYTYTLPSATGTLALTSSLSGYLPLTGGTLTGALNGTSGTFSGNVSTSAQLRIESSGNAILLVGSRTAQTVFEIYNSSNILRFYNGTNEALKIETGAGAATFSSSVTAGGVINANQSIILGGTTNNINSDNSLLLYSGNNNVYLQGSGGLQLFESSARNNGIGIQSNISFFLSNSERMRITSAGNVGIGTTSPGAPLHITNSASTTLILDSTDVNGGFVRFKRSNSDYAYVGSAYHVVSGGANTDLGLSSTTNVVIASGGSLTERMRITSGGNLLVGTTTDSGYPLIVGKSRDNGWQAAFVNTTSVTTAQVFLSHGDGYGAYVDSGVGGNSSSKYIFKAVSGGSERFVVRGDGLFFMPGIYNNTNSNAANVWVNSDGSMYRSTSSLKYKKNVQNYSKGLTELMQMRPVIYEGKCAIDEGKIFAGLIAEEIHDLGLTEFVQYAEDGTPDALAYSNMVSLLVKGIQELKAELDTLKNK